MEPLTSVGRLVDGMLSHPGETAVQVGVCEKLAVIACTEEGAERMVKEGCIVHVVAAMRNHATHARLQELACMILRRLSTHS